jgi:tetratricopeptide (TPR) repeat protein
MDGRMIRRLCTLGCLLAAATGCGDRTPKQQIPFPMPDTSGSQTSRLSPSKLFSGSKSNNPPPGPVEMAPPDANSKKPPATETLVAIADTRLEAAFDPHTVAGSKEGLLDLARHGYEKALQQDPKNKVAIRGMAQFYARVGERDKAIEMYKKYLTLYPDADIAHELAIAHARWKDMNGAVAWCDYALKIDPENRSVKKTKGFCLALSGKWDDSFKVLCQILPEAQARTNLAGLLDQVGRTDACKIQLQLAMKADPNYAPAAAFLRELEQPHDPNQVKQASDYQPIP